MACLGKNITTLDVFGHPISLTAKNKSQYQTLPGGIVTVITRVAVIAYFAT